MKRQILFIITTLASMGAVGAVGEFKAVINKNTNGVYVIPETTDGNGFYEDGKHKDTDTYYDPSGKNKYGFTDPSFEDGDYTWWNISGTNRCNGNSSTGTGDVEKTYRASTGRGCIEAQQRTLYTFDDPIKITEMTISNITIQNGTGWLLISGCLGGGGSKQFNFDSSITTTPEDIVLTDITPYSTQSCRFDVFYNGVTNSNGVMLKIDTQ